MELAKRPFTVTRTVGSLYVQSDQVAASENPFGSIGMMVVSDQAITTGITAVPDPVSQAASDGWFLYRSFGVQGGPIGGQEVFEFKFDSRAQRKVEEGFDIAVVVGNSAAAALGIRFSINFRMLVKLS